MDSSKGSKAELSLLHLPPELLSTIMVFVSKFRASAKHGRHLQDVRKTCRALRDASYIPFAEASFSTRRHAVSKHSLDALEEITAHPILGRHVMSIFLGCQQPSSVSAEQYKKNVAGDATYQKRYLETNDQVFQPMVSGKLHRLLYACFKNLAKWHNPIILGTFDNEYDHVICEGPCDHDTIGYGSKHLHKLFNAGPQVGDSLYDWNWCGFSMEVLAKHEEEKRKRPQISIKLRLEAIPTLKLLFDAAYRARTTIRGVVVTSPWYEGCVLDPRLGPLLQKLSAAEVATGRTEFDVSIRWLQISPYCQKYDCHDDIEFWRALGDGEARFKPSSHSLELCKLNLGAAANFSGYTSTWSTQYFPTWSQIMPSSGLRSLHLYRCHLTEEGLGEFLKLINVTLVKLHMDGVIIGCDWPVWASVIESISKNTNALQSCHFKDFRVDGLTYERNEQLTKEEEQEKVERYKYHVDLLEGETVILHGDDVYPGLKELCGRLDHAQRYQFAEQCKTCYGRDGYCACTSDDEDEAEDNGDNDIVPATP